MEAVEEEAAVESNSALEKLQAELAAVTTLGDEKMAAKLQAKIDKLIAKGGDADVMTTSATTTTEAVVAEPVADAEASVEAGALRHKANG